VTSPTRNEAAEAIELLRDFLSDRITPLDASEPVEVLLRCPPEVVAMAIRGWAGAQRAGLDAGIPFADYLYHCVEKIHSLGELNLVAMEQLGPFLTGVCKLLLSFCPPEDRPALHRSLLLIGKSEPTAATAASIVHRRPGSQSAPAAGTPAAAGASSAETNASLRRVSLLLERFTAQHGRPGSPERSALLSQIVSAAASGSKSGQDLELAFDALRNHGVEVQTDEIFRALGRQLPEWLVPGVEGAVPAPQSVSATAMHKLVAAARDPAEGSRRFHEMVESAVAQFNEGSVTRAATILAVARRVLDERLVESGSEEAFLHAAHESLDPKALQRFADSPHLHEPLRKVLAFWPELQISSLLAEVISDGGPERRLARSLLVAHGPDAYRAGIERLRSLLAEAGGAAEGHALRNLLQVLATLRRPETPVSDAEHELIGELATRDGPVPIVKEAIGLLGQMKHRKTEQVLIGRLESLTQRLLREPAETRSNRDGVLLLDRLAVALANVGTRRALVAVVEHSLHSDPKLGDTLGRLDPLGKLDLTPHKPVVERLLQTLESKLPRWILRLLFRGGQTDALHLITALAGTRSPEVQAMLESVARRFTKDEIGQAAAAAITRSEAVETPPPSVGLREALPEQAVPADAPGAAAAPVPAVAEAPAMAGDFELFGLPILLQNLAESKATAVLALQDAEGRTLGELHVDEGEVVRCKVRHLEGDDALYQLFEVPFAAAFTLVKRKPGTLQAGRNMRTSQILPLILEASRRFDELQQACAVVPDGTRLRATAGRKTLPAEDPDLELARMLWGMISQGATPEVCENALQADSYRIRRLLAHWLEESALEVVPPAGG
jgi:hypothetical protein